ncbi:MAG: motility protein A [Planctomycetales bacterium]|nr:motility protein A [Planctomycetales bacterium]
MDIATLLGMVLGCGLILASIAMGGGGLGPFINVPSMMITIGGAFAALLINFPLRDVLSMLAVVKNCFLTKLPTTRDTIQQFNEMATVARRDGLLALESRMEEITDPFLSRGLELVVAGTTKEDLQENMETELSYIDERHKTGKKIIDALAAAAPAFGMIGTLIGLVQMLRTLDDPSQIGGGMATALLTTLYGAVMANLFCIPLAGKLEARNQEESMVRELMIVGLCALLDGQTPRAVQERLSAFVRPKERKFGESQAA